MRGKEFTTEIAEFTENLKRKPGFELLYKFSVLSVFFVVSIFFTGCVASPQEFKGAVYASPIPPPEFTLPATTGEDFSIRSQQGVVTLVFFGYTFCPDVCPQTLGVVRSALGRLEPDERSQVQLVFITVDPVRDSLPVLTGYLARFDSGFIGVRPEAEDLAALTDAYDAFAAPEPPDGTTGEYEVSHTGVTYVVDKAGNLRLGFFTGMSVEDMAADLDILVHE